MIKKVKLLIFANILSNMLLSLTAKAKLPNICTVVKTPSFNLCMEFTATGTMCGWPIPRPCALISYYVPNTFIEVVSEPRESFFYKLPGALLQLTTEEDFLPYGNEDDNGSYSFHAHTLGIPFSSMLFGYLPCGGTRFDKFCFGSMSEHLGDLWKTGSADKFQPAFLAWSAAPNLCLIKGAATSLTGNLRGSHYPNMNMCSFDRSWVRAFPPSSYPVCNGWGIAYPRYGTTISSDQTTASLMIASRMKSLGNEVFNAVPPSGDEKWQMIYPQSSGCFREGQNIGILRAKRVLELGRLKGRMKNYLYATWKRVSCVVDWPAVPGVKAGIALSQLTCQGFNL
jgi:hypothetical protein